MSHILEQIIAHKKKEVEALKHRVPVKILEQSAHFDRTTHSLAHRLALESESGVIAEFKRRSPSKQDINLTASLDEVTRGYSEAGASAISILTDEHFFGGHDNFLEMTRVSLPDMPLLRKEFIIDEYQVLESKALGADIILLIAEVLNKEQVQMLSGLAKSLGLGVLLELHSRSQLDKTYADISMIGVNNRDLKTFQVDYNRSIKLLSELRDDIPAVAESGLYDVDTLAMLYGHGFKGFLIGEHFMKTDNPGMCCKHTIDSFLLKRGKRHIVN